MNAIKNTRLFLIVLLLIFFAFYAFYCFGSARIFVYGVRAQFRGHQQTGILAHKLVILKYPYSIISPASKTIYLIDRLLPPDKDRIEINIRTKLFGNINWLPLISVWRVSGFTIVALLLYAYCFIILNLFSLDQQGAKKDSFRGLIKFVIFLAIYGFWAMLVSYQIIALNHVAQKIPYNAVLAVDIFVSFIGLILFIKAIKKIKKTGKKAL